MGSNKNGGLIPISGQSKGRPAARQASERYRQTQVGDARTHGLRSWAGLLYRAAMKLPVPGLRRLNVAGTSALFVTLVASGAASQEPPRATPPATPAYDPAVPAPGASFRDWRRWLAGPPPALLRTDLPVPATSALRAMQGPRPQRETFRPPPRVGIGVGAAQFDSMTSERGRTGRDFSAEFAEQFRRAREDSARLVFGVLAMTVDRTVFPVDTLHGWLFTKDTVLQALAAWGAGALLFERGSPEPQPVVQATADSIVDRLLRYLVDGQPVWPSFWDSEPTEMGFVDRTATPRTTPPRIHGVPASLVEAYRDRVVLADDQGLGRPAERRGATIWIDPIEHLGPLVRITVRSAGTFVWHWVLVRVGDDWRIVGRFDYVI